MFSDVLSPRIHGILDYVTVLFFLLAPTLFDLMDAAAAVAYILAVVHLAMTVLTAFPLGMVDLIPFRVHGTVELVVAVALIALPWILGDVFFENAKVLFTVIGVVIFAVWLLTNYSATIAPASTERTP